MLGYLYLWEELIVVGGRVSLENHYCAGRQLVVFDYQSNPSLRCRFRGAPIESYVFLREHLFMLEQKLVPGHSPCGF